jgi:hypothetical protein
MESFVIFGRPPKEMRSRTAPAAHTLHIIISLLIQNGIRTAANNAEKYYIFTFLD